MQTTMTPRTMRMRSLRRLQRRVDRTIASEATMSSTSPRLGQIATLSIDLQRELARLEEMPWPSSRAFALQRDGRPLERQILPLVRALREERAL